MKRIIPVLAVMLFAAIFFLSQQTRGQAPDKISYQAVIRNASGLLVQDHIIGMRISILQGSTSGTAVYSETHSTNTNANGLVTVEIGTGSTGDDLSEIDWEDGPYFIKTETDPEGGSDYSISGISQILGVPYALYAKTAKYYDETDPVFDTHAASDITMSNISNWDTAYGWGNHATQGYLTSYTETDPIFTVWDKDYNDLINAPNIADSIIIHVDGSETKVSAGTNITVSGTGTMASPYEINTITHYIGESYGGGIVFYVYDNGQHGLIAATADQSSGIQWYNGTCRFTGTEGDGLGAGEMNTAMIVAEQLNDYQVGNFAAKVCADYSVTVNGITYGDWYLPSLYELNLLYLQKDMVGGFAIEDYWSSNEFSTNFAAWYVSFISGNQGFLHKENTLDVRAIRAF